VTGVRRAAALTVAALLAAGCSSAAGRDGDERARQTTAPRAGATLPTSAKPPAPGVPLPRRPAAVAERLVESQRALDEAVDRWRAEGLEGYPPPAAVTLWALHQQRLHLLLTARVRLADRVLPRLPRRIARHLRATFRARRGLRKITPPTPGRYRTGPPAPAAELLRHYRAAQLRFGVRWPVLAAINFIESAFGRMRNSSAAGAQGPMQFIPSTWGAYGMGGDINDPRDAIMGAANYLRASGAPGDLRNALYRYNPSGLYLDAVLAYANRIRRDRRAYLSYYSWQVFVRVPGGGARRTTGPGRG
jgi:hypothetical protein